MRIVSHGDHGRPHGGAKRAVSPLELQTKNQNFQENMKSAAQF